MKKLHTALIQELQDLLLGDPASLEILIHQLAALPSESGHPLTQDLSTRIQHDLEAGLKNIVEVEIRSIPLFIQNHLEHVIKIFLEFSQEALQLNRKIFLVGAGASGRMALFVKRALLDLAPDHPLTQKIIPIIAGGDAALIHAVPGFEDDPAMAKLQLKKQNFQPQDILIGFSASGRAPFILEALKQAKQQGGRILLVSTNPTYSLCAIDSSIPHLSLYTEPPAIAGSTRLSPTSHMMMACGVFIAQASLQLETPEEIKNALSQDLLHLTQLLEEFPWKKWAQILELESDHLQSDLGSHLPSKTPKHKKSGRMIYEISAPTFIEQIIFHDLTERTPTAGFPPISSMNHWESQAPQIAFAYPTFLKATSEKNSRNNLWFRLLGSENPVCLNLPSAPETLDKALFNFDFTPVGTEKWKQFLKKNRHDMATLSLSISPAHPASENSKNQNELSIAFNQKFNFSFKALSRLSPYFQGIFLKIILNTYSTGLMAKLGLIYKNNMSHLLPTNQKLVLRAVLQIEERLKEKAIATSRLEILKTFLTELHEPPLEPSSTIERTLHILLSAHRSHAQNT